MKYSSTVATLLLVMLFLSTALAQQQINDGMDSAIQVTAPRTARALIICGMLGDAEHRKLYAETVERLHAGLTTHHGFKPENVVLYWSDKVPEDAGPALKSAKPLNVPEASTNDAAAETLSETKSVTGRDLLAAGVADLEKAVQPDDTLWVFVLGHCHYDGRYSWLNVPGPDIQHIEFSKWFTNIRCREQVFFMTTSVSGFFQKPLAAPGRVVITATEPDLEVNETIFPHHLAKTLAEPPPFLDLDIDADGRLTLLDAYLFTCQQVAQEYATGMLLATEHALLDDSGDGKGTEVQANYLPEDLGGRLRAGRDKPILRTGDGARSRRILLDYPPSPPSPEDLPEM
jgi:hypothetical protein